MYSVASAHWCPSISPFKCGNTVTWDCQWRAPATCLIEHPQFSQDHFSQNRFIYATSYIWWFGSLLVPSGPKPTGRESSKEDPTTRNTEQSKHQWQQTLTLSVVELGWRWVAWLAKGVVRTVRAMPGVMSANKVVERSQLFNQVMQSAGLPADAVSNAINWQLSGTLWPVRTNTMLNFWLHRTNQNESS